MTRKEWERIENQLIAGRVVEFYDRGEFLYIYRYYSVWHTEEDSYEVPCKRVYTYYAYDGGETLQEILLDAVPGVLATIPFYRAVEHLDGGSGTCWREV